MRRPSPLKKFARAQNASSAVEFAIVAGPLFVLVLSILQMAVFYLTQFALDAGVIRTAESLRVSFSTGTTLTLPTAAALKSTVAANTGAMIPNTAALSVEIRQLTNLSAAVAPLVDGTMDTGGTTSVLVLRAQAQAFAFAPLFGALLTVRSSAMLRRQGT